MKLDKLSLQFALHDTGRAGDVLEAYERLIHDAMRGDHTLFTTAEGIERLWELSDPAARGPAAGAAATARLVGPERHPPADRARTRGGCRSSGAGATPTCTAADRSTPGPGAAHPHSPGVMPAPSPRKDSASEAVPDWYAARVPRGAQEMARHPDAR